MKKRARIDIELHKFSDGTWEHQAVIYTDGERIPLAPCLEAAGAYAAAEVYLAKNGLEQDYRSVEYDRCSRALIGRW